MVNPLVVQFCGVLLGILFATLIGAFILKSSCAVYDLLAGASAKSNPQLGPDGEGAGSENTPTIPGVPIPSFEWAMRIIFFATIVNTSGSFIILRFVRLAGLAAGRDALGQLSIFLISSPCGIIVLGGICAAMLPTSYGKGLLVSLLFHLLVVFFAAILAAVYISIALALGLSMPRFG